jgi:hypothetical protein
MTSYPASAASRVVVRPLIPPPTTRIFALTGGVALSVMLSLSIFLTFMYLVAYISYCDLLNAVIINGIKK